MSHAPRSIIIGASAGLGRSLAEQLAAQGHDLFLVASDSRDLGPLACDLSIRFGVKAKWAAADITRTIPGDLRRQILDALGGIENLLVIVGFSMLERDRGALPPAEIERLMAVNFTAPVELINAFLPDLSAPGTNLVGAGSVASVRGRRNNIVYAAAKRGLESYFESLRHLHAATGGARVQFYRLGFMRTRMTFGQRTPFPSCEPHDAAKLIVANLGRDLGTAYLPRWWWLIMTLLRLTPWPIFKRLNI